MQKAATFVRDKAWTLTATYELSLAILFLDRLGDREKDKYRIQTMALRLVAGQTTSGGWDYQCPLMTDPQKKDLLAFLQQEKRAKSFVNPIRTANDYLADPVAKSPGLEPPPLGSGPGSRETTPDDPRAN